ncbi:MAG: DUF72 domain-containing protein [Bacteroidetes bacterium]|nr:DUF72 domain-containing protein [Bacteroidota bacterium]
MSPVIHIGCCGWSYLNERDFTGELAGKYSSKLQAYATLFDTVEINSTFYRLPRLSTAEKWRREADEINPGFEFTVKVFRGITHLHRFQKNESLVSFKIIRDISSALRARCVLLQSPASFKPTPENIANMRFFFERIDRADLEIVWEPRGTWYDRPEMIVRVCEENGLVHCVDPFRNDIVPLRKNMTAYFRLHGFGEPTIYLYDFSKEELAHLHRKIQSLPPGFTNVYVLFNNDACYRNARTFQTTEWGFQKKRTS